MKTIFASLAFLFSIFAARADTVTGLVQVVGMKWSSGTKVVFTPTNTLRNINGTAVRSQPAEVVVKTNGSFSTSLIGPMGYKVAVGDTATYPTDVMNIFVPGDSGTYDWLSLTTNSSMLSSNNAKFIGAIKTNGTTVGSQLWLNFVGSVLATNDPTNGKIDVAISGGSSGEVTAAQLNTASNTLNARIIANDTTTSNGLYAQIVGGGVTASVATNISQYFATQAVAGAISWVARPRYFIDSINGSDSNAGTNAALAWQTIAKLTNTFGHTGSGLEINLARGSHWREILRLGSNNLVQAYGAGPRPILDASDIFTNSWVLDSSGGKTKTYAVSNVVVIDGANPQQINVFENGIPLWRSNTLAGVDAVAGTYSSSVDMPAGSSTNIVYIHSLGDAAPGFVEIAKRSHGLVATHHNTIIGIHTRNNMHNDGSMVLGLNCWVQDCLAENGSKHNALIASGVMEDTAFINASYQGSSAMLVVYNSADGLSFVGRRLRAVQDPRRPNNLSSGYLSHTAANGYARFELEDSTAEAVDSFGSVDLQSTGLGIYNRVTGLGLTTGGYFARTGSNIFLNPLLLDTASRQLSTSARAFDVAGRVWIAGARVGRISGGTQVYGASSDTDVNIHQSLFWNADATVTATLFAGAIGASNVYFTVSNTIAQGQTYIYLMNTNEGVRAAGSNVFKLHGSMSIGGTNFSNWGNYQASSLGLDTGSVTNEPLFLGDPVAGDFRYAATSPAVTNRAGPGWDAVRVPAWPNARGLLTEAPQRLSSGPNWFLSMSNVLAVANAAQVGSANLTNWSGYSTNALTGKLASNAVLGNLAAGAALTNANAFQPANSTLANLAGTGAITNLQSAGNTNTTQLALVHNGTNITGRIKTVSVSGAMTITDSGTNIDFSTSGSAGEANVNGEISITNATRIGLVAGKSGVTNLLRSIEPGYGLSITNQGTNIVLAVDGSVISSAARANSISNLAASKQSGSFLLSNLLAMGISNIIAGTNMFVQTNNGTLVLNSPDVDTGGGGITPGGEMTALVTLNGTNVWADLGDGMYIDDSLQFGQSIFGGRDFGTASGNRSFGQTYSPAGISGSHNWFTCLASNGQYGALRYGGASSAIGAAAVNLWSNRFHASTTVILQGGGNTFTNTWIMFGATSERFDQGLTTDGVKWEAKPGGDPNATWYAGCGLGSTWTYVTSTIPVTNYLVKLSMRGDYRGVAFYTNDVWFAGISNNIPTNRIYNFGIRHLGVSSPATPATNQVLSFWRNIKALIQ